MTATILMCASLLLLMLGFAAGLSLSPRILRWFVTQADHINAPSGEDIVEELRRTDSDMRRVIAERNKARSEAATLREALDRQQTTVRITRPQSAMQTVAMGTPSQLKETAR